LAQRWSEDIGCDDDELAGEADFHDGLRKTAIERDAGDDDFAFAGLGVPLARGDLPREDDVFEINDGEIVIFKLLCGVSGYNLIQGADQLPKLVDCWIRHA